MPDSVAKSAFHCSQAFQRLTEQCHANLNISLFHHAEYRCRLARHDMEYELVGFSMILVQMTFVHAFGMFIANSGGRRLVR